VGTALVASFAVRALGDDASANVTVTVSLPTTLTIQSVSANGGTCTTGAALRAAASEISLQAICGRWT